MHYLLKLSDAKIKLRHQVWHSGKSVWAADVRPAAEGGRHLPPAAGAADPDADVSKKTSKYLWPLCLQAAAATVWRAAEDDAAAGGEQYEHEQHAAAAAGHLQQL